MTHKGGRLLSTLVCFLFSYLTLTVLFSYIRGLFVYCPFLLGRFILSPWTRLFDSYIACALFQFKKGTGCFCGITGDVGSSNHPSPRKYLLFFRWILRGQKNWKGRCRRLKRLRHPKWPVDLVRPAGFEPVTSCVWTALRNFFWRFPAVFNCFQSNPIIFWAWFTA